MAKCTLAIAVDLSRIDSFMSTLVPLIEVMPQEAKDKLGEHWSAMEKGGAQLTETLFRNGVLYACISDDFRRALAEFGIFVDDRPQ